MIEYILSMHGIADPNNRMSAPEHSIDVSWQVIIDLSGAVAGDEGDTATLSVRVDDLQKAYQLVGSHARSDLDTDRVANASEVLDMRASQLSGAVANPDEMRRGVVPGFAGNPLRGPIRCASVMRNAVAIRLDRSGNGGERPRQNCRSELGRVQHTDRAGYGARRRARGCLRDWELPSQCLLEVEHETLVTESMIEYNNES